ncbi:ABC transporter ATP-binding protein [Treponema parvum]|uniref:ABC transporter ATP-binding protein n=1 Tax=Treponema parvum TaxID=138851 RepID=A0A975F300_9SPIR|nr:ABC transporter ATP-binding protein [Treponema parvum]QTQ13360.1 ABC transporter ATP-binding protein [Treponema parvum]
MLEANNVTVKFGGLVAVDHVSLKVKEHTIHSIIGPNGAGKSTFFNAVSGIHALDEGVIKLQGKEIQGLPPDKIARNAVGRTFQNIKLFKSLSVLENVLCGSHMNAKSNLLQDIFHTKAEKNEEERLIEKAVELLKSVELGGVLHNPAGSLPYGDQRKLEIARALISNPKLLLLDEPAAGMNPIETDGLKNFILGLKEKGYTILLIEHHVRMVMSLADMITVLDHGKKIAEGGKDEIQNNELVIEAYLGKAYRSKK